VAIGILGDSLALGLGAERPEDGFVFRSVAASQGNARLIVRDFAIVSATILDVYRLEVPRLAQFECDIVIMCVGANDAVLFRAPGDFASAYDATLKAIRHRPRPREMICCSIPDPKTTAQPLGEELLATRSLVREYNSTIRSLSISYGSHFVDFTPIVATVGSYSSDGFHPSSKGHQEMATRLEPILRSVIERIREK